MEKGLPISAPSSPARTLGRFKVFRTNVFPRLSERLRGWVSSLKSQLGKPVIITVIAVVLVFNVVVRTETVRNAVPQIAFAQLRFHRVLCAMSPRLLTAKWVRAVEIDQQKHAELGEPTNRAFLASVISQAARGDAAVIVLDIKLLAPQGMAAGHDLETQSNGDARLLDAIRNASANGVPIVLTSWLQRDTKGNFRRMPNFFLDEVLPLPDENGNCIRSQSDPQSVASTIGPFRPPGCVRIGNINAPTDLREVPLVTRTVDPEGRSMSVALATATAYEEAIQRLPRTADKKRIRSAIAHDENVFASFIQESEFQKIPIQELAEGARSALEKCRGRIIIIGGNFREDLGHGTWVDSYETPVGEMRGMYLHANYIEALLDDRYQSEVPLGIGLTFDIVAGAWLYIRFHKAKTRIERARLLIIPGFLLLGSYVVFANLNLYLDFILPLGACFAHLAVEYFRDYRRMREVELAASMTDAGDVLEIRTAA